jgi:hypothetical protein
VREIAVLHDGSPPFEYIEASISAVTTTYQTPNADS